MARILTPTTIIPPELYVERSADRQLRDVIRGMGRPGYVLVARQMGKTNLLLNARRSLESSDLLFVYIDLSIKLTTLNRYYGLLLETASNVHQRLLQDAGIILSDEYTPAQFEAILRSVLSSFSGRLVFVLDEIDSLANYPFSDQIFSQIRSLYFARSNYSEYNRITYILSGVAEPSDLIKDKNVSPFNIGEKIYLNDFTFDEFDTFVEQAGLVLPAEIKNRIFSWAGGNPRMTWDICSEVESEIDAGPPITVTTIDKLVNDLYLTTFDRPPVDHVRTIVQSERDIRGAVTRILTGKSAEISDKIRSRLYLAGIIGMQSAASSDKRLHIKNKVLEEALSQRWLADVEKQTRGLLQLARENFDEKRFEPALAYFEEYLSQNDLDPSTPDAYRLANSYFATRRFPKAIEWFCRYRDSQPKSLELLEAVNFLLGRSHTILGNIDAAMTYFKAAISLQLKSSVRLNAQAFLASALLQVDSERHISEAKELSEEALNEADTSSANINERINIRAICLANLATIKERQNNRVEAIELLERAMAEGSLGYQPYLTMRLIDLYETGSRRDELLDQLSPSTIRLTSAPPEDRPDNALSQISFSALIKLRLNGRLEEFHSLLTHLEHSGEAKAGERYKTYTALWETAGATSGDGANVFLRDIILEYGDTTAAQPEVLVAAKVLLVRSREFSLSPQFIRLRSLDLSTPFDELDFLATGLIIIDSLNTDNIRRLRQLDEIVIRLRETSSMQNTLVYGWLRYLEIARAEKLGRFDQAAEAAHDVLDLLERDKKGKTLLFPDDLQGAMERRAKAQLKAFEPKSQIHNIYKHFGRNTWVRVRYGDNEIVRQKFKNVQRDLVLGNCTLVEAEK